LSGRNQGGEQHRDEGAHRSVDDKLFPAFKPAGKVPPKRGKQHERSPPDERHCAQVRGRAAEVVQHEPALPDRLNPRPDLKRHGAEQKDAEVAMSQRSQRATGRNDAASRAVYGQTEFPEAAAFLLRTY